ncbi:hypothetical protein [Alkaliphilus metalliredigens]|uniref:hypothetical protein n=1 Tax=Alkaliphilus metalliredigens TaxID=208226 RepID=UPI00005CB636|nr:hypothetical protein [Alkaliphilus metalliredigens]
MGSHSLRSMLLGVGIGMVLTASFNLLVNHEGTIIGDVLQPKEIVEEIENNVEKQIEEMKDRLDTTQEKHTQENIQNGEKEKNAFWVTIQPGMSTREIAEYLYENEVILNSDEFIKKVSELQLTRSLKYGKTEIPFESSLEEVLMILKDL